MRLNPRFRFALYAAFSALFATGSMWLLADALKDTSNGDFWQAVAANLLMLHGTVTMVTLMLLGALIPLHIQRAWQSRKNRSTGTAMITFNAILILTGLGLYYAGSDTFRPWISYAHIGAGLMLPVLLIGHVLWGRRAVRQTRFKA